jgi:hypothetical protein
VPPSRSLGEQCARARASPESGPRFLLLLLPQPPPPPPAPSPTPPTSPRTHADTHARTHSPGRPPRPPIHRVPCRGRRRRRRRGGGLLEASPPRGRARRGAQVPRVPPPPERVCPSRGGGELASGRPVDPSSIHRSIDPSSHQASGRSSDRAAPAKAQPFLDSSQPPLGWIPCIISGVSSACPTSFHVCSFTLWLPSFFRPTHTRASVSLPLPRHHRCPSVYLHDGSRGPQATGVPTTTSPHPSLLLFMIPRPGSAC